MADACRTGAATDIIFGLALGYKSAIIPCFMIAICIFTGFTVRTRGKCGVDGVRVGGPQRLKLLGRELRTLLDDKEGA